ncbi:MAG TPA: hypothetical protein VHP99_20365 [Pyrinomonadaceae bacterium]|jgi:hypothetical protein|nr:hypothetical protein [Pyrinomonadaceae bacterium]
MISLTAMMMTLIRLGGLAAVLAGILRLLSSILPTTSPRIMALYLVIDILLLISSIGLFEFQRLEAGIPGKLALLLQVLGALVLIGRDLAILSDAFYPIGALTFAVGLDLFAITSWKAKNLPRWVLFLLILSTVIGPIGFFSPSLSMLFVVSGMAFGIGFASAGGAICFLRHRR